jgi:zinc transporter ZupT
VGNDGARGGVGLLPKEVKRWMLDAMLGFAAGVMIAASYFSLLAPAVEFAEAGGTSPWIPAVVGFLGGGIFLRGIDWVLPHLHPRDPMQDAEGIKTSWHRSVLLVLAITLHNIPEGLASGSPSERLLPGFLACPRPPRSRRRRRSQSALVFRTSRRGPPSLCR